MATRITDRAAVIAKGMIQANSTEYTVFHDGQVGQRVKMDQGDRWWLILKHPTRTIRQSTTKRAVYADWMALIQKNGTPAWPNATHRRNDDVLCYHGDMHAS